VGVEDFSFHDMRHTYASYLRIHGADLHDLQKLLEHSYPRMTNRYAHLSNEYLGHAARLLDGVLSLPSTENRSRRSYSWSSRRLNLSIVSNFNVAHWNRTRSVPTVTFYLHVELGAVQNSELD